MSGNNSSASSGIGLFGVLGIVFVILKLVGVIDWSWWLVLLPLYGSFALILALAVIGFTCFGIYSLGKRFRKK